MKSPLNKCLLFCFITLFQLKLWSDSFQYNTFNNHGVIGLVNMPTARFYNEQAFGITIYNGDIDQKITMTSSPYSWLEASFFYMNLPDNVLCRRDEYSNQFCQGYKDKGFNFKLKVKDQGRFPALAIGINDIAGTGYYSSEYIVASYAENIFDFHIGLGWGELNGANQSIQNPFGYIYDGFKTRPESGVALGGQFQPSRYFSGASASPFFGLSTILSDKLLFKFEKDTTKSGSKIGHELASSDYTYAIDFLANNSLTIGASYERGNFYSLKFTYKQNPNENFKPYKYQKPSFNISDNKYVKFIKGLETNSLGVNRIIETPDFLAVEITQLTHPTLDGIEEIIEFATYDAGIDKTIKKELKIANLSGVKEYESEYLKNAKLIYERPNSSYINSNTSFKIRPFFAAREGFFKWSLLLENDTEFVITDNFFFTTNLKFSLDDNFDDLTLPPEDTYPAQVRSDIKDYLRNIDEGIKIGRAQFDYHLNPFKDNHLMITAGILEDMFMGYGFEYLYFQEDKNYGVGFEIFDVVKRDHMMQFGRLDYENTVGAINFYYRNYQLIPFDLHVSYGEYLAGDRGSSIELSRKYLNGMEFGVFATFTDVTSEEFGEGAFDKGIFFNIPIYGNFINYSWRPLTKDPGAKLNRKNSLHNLLLRFRPYQ